MLPASLAVECGRRLNEALTASKPDIIDVGGDEGGGAAGYPVCVPVPGNLNTPVGVVGTTAGREIAHLSLGAVSLLEIWCGGWRP
jgi:hypothetical protein